ncbi:hypothetical protein AMK32_31515 [Streptomyces sp. CB01883]|nr:hypothetical protein AMK32_31515 [Streptomyces sp. CB01883]
MGIDYAAVFQALPGALALLTPDLVFADANIAFLRQADRTREQVVGRYLFDAFPDNIALIIHRVEEVTELLRATSQPDGAHQLEAELFSRMRQLHQVNERLRRAHGRERR